MPAGDGRDQIRADLHSHTRASMDCLCDPEAVVRTAAARGIDRIAITDHNRIDGALAMRDAHPERVIVGEEVKTREGFDLIGLFLEELVPRGTPARVAAEQIRAQGGVVYVPHPFDGARSGAGAAFLASLADLIDVVEVHNSRCWLDSVNTRALRWADEHGKLRGAGSDAHTLAEIGNGFVELPPFEPNRDSFLASLSAGTVAGRVRSSPIYRVASTYAKVHKKVWR